MKNVICAVAACLILLISTHNADAKRFDFGDAPGYGNAKHRTNQWQQLGSLWDRESSPRINDHDDGVFWSTDGGATWDNPDLAIGSEVVFRFDMWRSSTGRHDYDQIKAWVDWNGDNVWDNVGENILAEKWMKDNNSGINNKSFYATLLVPEYAAIGETWLRARVSCDHTSFKNTTPYGKLWQGEVEDWKLNVAPVPEPSTMILLGSGLIGVYSLRRRENAKK